MKSFYLLSTTLLGLAHSLPLTVDDNFTLPPLHPRLRRAPIQIPLTADLQNSFTTTNTESKPEAPHLFKGTIHLQSPDHHTHIPLHFAISSTTCGTLSLESRSLITELADVMVEDFPQGFAPSDAQDVVVEETIALWVDGKEYAAVMEVKLQREGEGKKEMGRQEWVNLVAMMRSAALEIGAARKERGGAEEEVGDLWVEGLRDDMGIRAKASWTYWVVDAVGEMVLCTDGGAALGKVEL